MRSSRAGLAAGPVAVAGGEEVPPCSADAALSLDAGELHASATNALKHDKA
jgi:hypothetical protein